jgi:hypothetical protein
MIPFGLHVEGGEHAGIGSDAGIAVLVCGHGAAGARQASASCDQGNRRRRAGLARCRVQRLYEGTGRQSIAPERLLRASLLQAFCSVRSERQLMEQIDYNLLFRWFVGLGIDDPVWDHSTFSKNRDRLLQAQVAATFLEAVLRHPRVKRFRYSVPRQFENKIGLYILAY